MPDPINITKHLNLLGYRVCDRVTGLEGVVTSISFDLYGCIQAILNPGLDKDGRPRDQIWFDVGRLAVTGTAPVMHQPAFDWSPENISSGLKGAAEKPINHSF